MEFRIAKDTFLKGLQRVQGIVEKRTTMPILSNVLIEATESKIELTATDLEVGMNSSYPATIIKPGKLTVSAKKLYEIIKELPDQEIHVASRDNDWIDISCGRSHFSIVGLSPTEFPYFPRIQDDHFLVLSGATIAAMIERTMFAICHDETKYNLNGVFTRLEGEGENQLLKFVATDGHRLAIADAPLTGNGAEELKKGIILPRKGIMELKKLAEEGGSQEILLGFMDNSAVLKKGELVVVMRLVDGEFPDYNRVVPAGNDKTLRANRDDLIHALKRMAILSSEKYKGIKLEVKEQVVEISSSNPELGEAREEVEVTYNGGPITIRFNARYLIEALQVVAEEQVQLAIKDELSPALIMPASGTGFLSVIMPMRL
ncbi:MAG TPA: DNA polymerase III subunit beta [Geobacterales bacterium]|nr:DNA polymerase III subunit beta [Geobacterales bacterium]